VRAARPGAIETPGQVRHIQAARAIPVSSSESRPPRATDQGN